MTDCNLDDLVPLIQLLAKDTQSLALLKKLDQLPQKVQVALLGQIELKMKRQQADKADLCLVQQLSKPVIARAVVKAAETLAENN